MKIKGLEFKITGGDLIRLDFDIIQEIETDVNEWALNFAKEFVEQNKPNQEVLMDTVKVIEDEVIEKVEAEKVEEISNDNNARNTYINDFEKMIDEAADLLASTKDKFTIKQLMNASDNEVYDIVIDSLEKMYSRFSRKLNVAKKFRQKKREILKTTDTILDLSKDKETVLSRLKMIAAVVVRKSLALLKGTLMFTFDTTTILGIMVGRIVFHTGKEMYFAGKAIVKAFKKDIIDTMK